MNAKTKAAVMKHGQNLLKIFPNATIRDPVELCRKLRRIERDGEALGLRLCNGPQMPQEGRNSADGVKEQILAKAYKLLGIEPDGKSVPIFLNLDPRGYALKIDDETMRELKLTLYSDWGGYGIIAPDLDE